MSRLETLSILHSIAARKDDEAAKLSTLVTRMMELNPLSISDQIDAALAVNHHVETLRAESRELREDHPFPCCDSSTASLCA